MVTNKKEGVELVFENVRQFIEALRQSGDVVYVDREVDWDLEVGAISRRAYEMNGPAVWFRKIKDYPEGYTIFNGSLGTWRRLAISMGLTPTTPIKDIYAEYEHRLKTPIKPVVVGEAPFKENIVVGDDVDLYQFPAPIVHEGDGGRYIATWHVVVCKDPDTGWTNWGMYRFMIHNKRSLAGWPQPTSHLNMILQKSYLPKKQPMPIALAIGADPMSSLVATAGFRPGEDEADFAGALRQKPVELVKCETSDLLVPAQSEIVIEAEVLPDMIAHDGPFGEYTGYRSGEMGVGIACRVKAITHRSSPILTINAVGMPVDDTSLAASVTAGIAIKRALIRRGIPVTDVYVPPEGVTHLVIVGVKSGGSAVAQQILDVVTARRVMISKVIVVDEDVDVFNLGQVIHAFATKCSPSRGILLEHYEGRGNALTPYYSPRERKMLKGATAVFDSTWPLDWSREEDVPVKASFNSIYPEELQERVIANWSRYGFK